MIVPSRMLPAVTTVSWGLSSVHVSVGCGNGNPVLPVVVVVMLDNVAELVRAAN